MKAQTLSTLVALVAGLQQVAATSGWNDFPPFTCSQNSHDICVPDQQGGYDFSDLSLGDFSSYKSFGFSGFSCKNSPKKRTGDSFGSGKCIAGIAHPEPEKCPKFSGSGVGSFTVDEIHVRPEYDCDLEFHYGMKDGSVCKQKSSCSKDGSVVQNKQCGGARDVTIVIVNPPKEKPSCSIEVHKIGFNCASTTASTVQATTTSTSTSTSTSTTPAVTTAPAAASTSSSPAPVVPPTTSTSAPPAAGTTSTTSTSSTAPVVVPPTTLVTSKSTSSAVAPPAASTSSTSSYVAPPSSYVAPPSSQVAPPSSQVAPPPATYSSSAPPAVVTTAAGSSPSTVQPAATSSSSPSFVTTSVFAASTSAGSVTIPPPGTSVTTVIVETTVTTCPVTNTITTGGSTSIQVTQTVSTITTTRTATICDKCVQATTVAPAPSSQPSAPCPAILPSCLSTWLSIVTECSSNDDAACYCPNSNFTILVFGCLSAHGATDDEVYSAQLYFQGICAPHVSVNPAIITGASSVTPTATTPAAAQVTTIQILTTVIVPCTQSNGPASTTTVISSAVTVPQVIFTTVSGSSVGLVPGTPPPATATPAAAVTTLNTVTPTKAGVSGSGSATVSGPPKFTGAASRSNTGMGMIGAAAAFALFAL